MVAISVGGRRRLAREQERPLHLPTRYSALDLKGRILAVCSAGNSVHMSRDMTSSARIQRVSPQRHLDLRKGSEESG